MFVDETLQNHLEESSVVKLQSLVVAEWNMNIADNIEQIGNYRFRPLAAEGTIYKSPAASFDYEDDSINTPKFYYGATDSDITIDGGLTDDGTPIAFTTKKQKEKLLYSLEDCFGRFRPRSGINKLRYLSKVGQFINHANPDVASRPRYYMADKMDPFKYWTSYRIEDGIERGIANQVQVVNNVRQYFIDDAAPYITYKEDVPANRVVVKMQTNVGDVQLGSEGTGSLSKGVFVNADGEFADPFYGSENQTTPINWKVQALKNDNWVDLLSFNSTSTRRDGTQVIGSNGYVELAYGLIIPDEYYSAFFYAGDYSSSDLLPPEPSKLRDGVAYLVKDAITGQETFYVVSSGEYKTFIPSYGWYLEEDAVSFTTNFATNLTSPETYTDPLSGSSVYKELDYIGGLRVVVETMNVFDSTFDLIELSPRLAVDLSDKTKSFSITKSASDLGVSGMPVGQLLASTGSLEIFDYDQAFFSENTSSVISKYLSQNIQTKFYEITVDVDGYDYYIPMKTMYSEGFPEVSSTDRQVTLNLRDMFFYFESVTAPQMFLQNVSSSYAISILLDNAGFSNYTFKRNSANEKELIIPNFSVAPDRSLAEVLQDLALSSQSAMFFNEENNFVVMSREYIMPTEAQRATDVTLYGSKDSLDFGVEENKQGVEDPADPTSYIAKTKLANIVELSSTTNDVYNDGLITYKTAYIQKSYSSIAQAQLSSKERTWIYKPSLLWEISPETKTVSKNEEIEQNAYYALAAVPLNSNLSADVPSVSGNNLINNTIDFGDGIFNIGRYNGYLYANGEIIRYDAVQYSIPGLSDADRDANVNADSVWITSVQDYQRYFAKVPFNGKIYPTGLVRIYSEPNYITENNETRLRNGPVAKHGRGQFGTEIISHSAGLSQEWSSDTNLRGVNMDFSYLSNPAQDSTTTYGLAGASVTKSNGSFELSNTFAKSTIRNSLIKNLLASQPVEESAFDQNLSTQSGTIQASALVMQGANTAGIEQTPGFVSYIYKKLEDRFTHFGTRVRLVGRIENNPTRGQTPYGVNTYYTATPDTLDQSVSIGGTSAGLAVMINPETNNGYYFEIMALSENDPAKFSTTTSEVHDVIFYKIKKDVSAGSSAESKAIPIKLWGGIANINVDNGLYTGANRISTEEVPTVYDLAVEYKKIGSSLRFYLYINGTLIATVDDKEPPLASKSATVTKRSLIGTTATLTTSAAHNIPVNTFITVNGVSDIPNGRYKVTSVTSKTMSFTVPKNTFVVSKASLTSNVVTLTTSLAHGFVSGNSVSVSNISATFNGTYTLTGATANTVSYAKTATDVSEITVNGVLQAADKAEASSSGTVSYFVDIAVYNNMALFIRGATRAMFENVYALADNYSQNTMSSLDTVVSTVFGDNEINTTDSFQKYALSGMIQSTYLSGIGTAQPPKYKIYYDEFGTIMREAAHINVRYDKAYPALYANLVPTLNKLKSYTVSGFRAGAYGAEFLVFNSTDSTINLDSSTANYLKINGITFTQQSQNELSVDDFFAKRSDMSNPQFIGDGEVISPLRTKEDYYDIKVSRMTHGKKQFSLNTPFVQSHDDASELMSWMISKIMKPRKAVGLKLFAMPTLQLGDIVSIDYTNQDGVQEISATGSRFVVYSIQYSRNNEGPEMTVYLSEVK